MRTTLTIDDTLMRQLKRLAAQKGLPFKDVVNYALRMGLDSMAGKKRSHRFRQRTHAMGKPLMNIDKALQLAGELENEEIRRKQDLRK